MLTPFTAVLAVIVFSQAAEARCRVARVETDVNAIRLDDEDSVQRVLGDRQALPIGANQKKPEESDFPEPVLYSRDETEQAALTQYPGAVHGSFAVIEVGEANPRLVGKTLAVHRLSTERGIRLGVSEKFVTELLGSCHTRRVSRSGETTLADETEDMNHPFLKRVGMPNYFARYRIREGKQVSLTLGSDYP